CAQVKSVQDRHDAQEVAQSIEKTLSVPVDIVQADLGARGTWWRVCVGDEDSEGRLLALATRWTSPGGPIEQFLDEAKDNAPRFFELSRATAEKRIASPAQATALYSFAVDGAVVFFGIHAAPLVAANARTSDNSTDVVVVDPAGQRVPLDSAPAVGCAACELALKSGRVVARRVLSSGDVTSAAGAELLVEEDIAPAAASTAGAGVVTFVTVLERLTPTAPLSRAASTIVSGARAGFIARGSAAVFDAGGRDPDGAKQIVVAGSELTVDGAGAAAVGCSLERHAALFDVVAHKGLVKVDVMHLPGTPVEPVLNAIGALDAAGDHGAASRACAAQLASTPQAPTAQLCLQRIRRLRDADALVDAVNAAGLVAESSSALRPVIAAAFHDAMVALDQDPRFTFVDPPCKERPLVAAVAGKSVDDVINAANAADSKVLRASDIDDAVIVTGARDFGPDTPVGTIALAWLAKEKQTLPARAAAVEALLLPQRETP
ncbi:MAG TPA: hypothetical protein VGO62_20175, partial [Myxococcota bacterium]